MSEDSAMCSKQKEKKRGEEREQQHVQTKSKKRKEICPYGNYKHYYGYRIGQELEEDPRLKVFKKEWFQGKDCLDIGCNSGIMTIQIAKKFCCQSIIGVDINGNRIQDAYCHIRKILKMEDARKVPGKASKLEGANGSERSIKGSLKEEMKRIPRNCCSEEKNLIDVVSFQKEDFVNTHDPPKKHYYTIIWAEFLCWNLNLGSHMKIITKCLRQLEPIIKILSSIRNIFKTYFWTRLDLEQWRMSLPACRAAKLDSTDQF